MTTKIRVFRVCPLPGHLSAYQAKYPENFSSFSRAIKTLQDEDFLLPGELHTGFEQLGVDYFEVIYDDWLTQGAWAKENHCEELFLESDPSLEILARQVDWFKPDILLIWAGAAYLIDPRVRSRLRKKITSNPKFAIYWGDEIPPWESYQSYFGDIDHAFVSNSSYAKFFEEFSISCSILGNTFNDRIPYAPKHRADIIFSGHTGYNTVDHIGRYEQLKAVLQARRDVKVFSFEKKFNLNRNLKTVLASIFAKATPTFVVKVLDRLSSRVVRSATLKKLFRYAYLSKKTGIDPEKFGNKRHPKQNYFLGKKSLKRLFPNKVFPGFVSATEYYNALAGAKICLNIHRDEEADYGNLRCFEATALGVLLVTDRVANSEFFEIGKEIVVFDGIDDLMEKLDYYLANPDAAEKIAKRGQAKTLSCYRPIDRCRLMTEQFESILSMVKPVDARTLVGIYDTTVYPISYDVAFFAQALLTEAEKIDVKSTKIIIVLPEDEDSLPGVSAAANEAINRRERRYRIYDMLYQTCSMFPVTEITVTERRTPDVISALAPTDIFFNMGFPHMREFYQIVNKSPDLCKGFEADQWLVSLLKERFPFRYVTITIRDYPFDPIRNSNLKAWREIALHLKHHGIEVILVPDTTQYGKHASNELVRICRYVAWEAALNIKLRFALYECAEFNFFVNNGPATVAGLNKRIKSILFKITVPTVPHCSAEFINSMGFEIGKSPSYNPDHHWVWADDDEETILSEVSHRLRLRS